MIEFQRVREWLKNPAIRGSIGLVAVASILGNSSCDEQLDEIERQVNEQIAEEQAGASGSGAVVKGNAPRFGSFNGLGASHGEEPKHRDKPNWRVRSLGMIALFERHGIDIVGVQEFQRVQWHHFKEHAGDQWAIYPEVAEYPFPSVNSIIYNTQTIRIVKDESGVRGGYKYFDGKPNKKMVFVKAEYIPTGQDFKMINGHYPAFVGNAESREFNADRDRDWAESEYRAGEWTVIVGDHNAKGYIRKPGDSGVSRAELPYCVITENGIMRHAKDAVDNKNKDSADYHCPDKDKERIDDIYGSKNIDFLRYGEVSSGSVSDHPLIFADIQHAANITSDSLGMTLPEGTELDDVDFAEVGDVYAKAEEEQLTMLALMAEVRDVYAKPEDYDSLGSQDDYNEAA